jgi:hypothetical protein
VRGAQDLEQEELAAFVPRYSARGHVRRAGRPRNGDWWESIGETRLAQGIAHSIREAREENPKAGPS